MTKARDTSEVTNVVIAANAIGDILAPAANLNNSITDRVAHINIPGGATPTSVSTTGSFNVINAVGTASTAVTAVALDTRSCAGIALIDFDASIASSDEVYFIEAASADASITISY